MIVSHWCQQASVMGYVAEGSARLIIPSTAADHRCNRFDLNADDMHFIPQATLHMVKNVGNVQVKI
jgi:oxalate decarboxylase/phosphoglucose isomerase-like protein (cupin superfamily)